MRIPQLAALALFAASPLAAQSQQKIVILDNDTLVTVERSDLSSSCTVKIGDRTLPDRQAREICDRRVKESDLNRIRLEDLSVSLDSTRARLRLFQDSILPRRLTTGRLAEDLAAQSLALREQARAMAGQESMARWQSRLFESLARATQQGAIIGVTVDARPRDTDRWGAYVAGVTPNYPADRAGIRVGDIIVSINGQSIASGPVQVDRTPSSDESMVWLRLTEVVRKLEPGKPVDLVYRRDGRNVTTRITPIEDRRWYAVSPAVEEAQRVLELRLDEERPGGRIAITPSITLDNSRGSFSFFRGGTLANFEFAPLNEKLGSYFGTSSGVLVLSAPESENLGLESGDVVTAVDGRSIDTPSELIRVLRTYDKGKQFTLQVMRNKQRQSIQATLP
jgi:hypothetical protein